MAVIIPVFGQPQFTNQLLGDLSTERDLVEIFIVDNHGGYEPMAGEHVLRSSRNLGWAGGCNLGLGRAAASQYELYVLLNNDTRLSPGFLGGLMQAYGETGAGLIAPVFNDVWPQHMSAHTGDAASYSAVGRHREVMFVDGTCMAIPAGTYERVGGLDDTSFGRFGWGAEVDYSARVREAGMSVCVTELAFMTHVRHGTANALSSATEEIARAEMHVGMAAKWGSDWTHLLDTSARLGFGNDTVSVITPSIPERYAMLGECVAAVASQKRRPDEHFVSIDHRRTGGAEMLNRMARMASSAWLAVVDDDDLIDPPHLETLLRSAWDADIIYPYCRVSGRDWCPNRPFDPVALRQANYIPVTAILRKTIWERLGGWSSEARQWDYDLWLRALDAGATFKCVPEVTWTYRFHGGNHSIVGTSS